MSSYLVLKHIKEDRSYEPGEILIDPDFAAILVERGYLSVVPDNFVPPPTSPVIGRRSSLLTAADDSSTIDESEGEGGDATTPTEPSAGGEGGYTVDNLMTLNRKDLDDLATELGIEGANEMANKRLVAEAVLVKQAAEADRA